MSSSMLVVDGAADEGPEEVVGEAARPSLPPVQAVTSRAAADTAAPRSTRRRFGSNPGPPGLPAVSLT